MEKKTSPQRQERRKDGQVFDYERSGSVSEIINPKCKTDDRGWSSGSTQDWPMQLPNSRRCCRCLALQNAVQGNCRPAKGNIEREGDEAMNNEPLWSRCSLGRNRWYWVVWRCFVDVCNETGPIASGFAPSAEECETAALAVEPSAAKVQASWANSHHRKTCIQRRVRKPASDSKQTVQQEYLYTDHDKGDWWDGTGDWLYSQAHRIVKVTKQSVFVEKEYWRSQIGVETYRLDR